jgi:hypothetical protein
VQHVLVAGFLEVREHDLLGIGVRIGAALAELAGATSPSSLLRRA